MSYQHSQKQNPKPQIIGRINLKYSPNSQIKYISQSKKRGISANAKLKNQNISKSKDPNSIINNIITQVKKDQKFILKKPLKNQNKNNNEIIINKSHSHSPNRLINSQIKLNNGLLPPKISDKKTLVLDLDETLVHSGFIPFNCPSDVIIKIELDNNIHDIHVLVRPGVKEFLEKMSKRYEIVIFTASLSKYADPLLDIIDKQGFCPFRLFREHCTLINTAFVKDLKKLGRDLKDIIIVDNSPISYALIPINGIPILSWFNDKNDRELYNIMPILEFLSYVNDVREHIKKFVIGNEINFNKVMNDINSYNSMIKKGIDTKNILDNQGNQQVNINIINNQITNIICNDNNDVSSFTNHSYSESKKNDSKVNKYFNNERNPKNLKNMINKNKKYNNSLRLYHPKKKDNNFQFPQTTTHKKNNFLSSYSYNVNTMRSHNLSNLNQNQSNQVNLSDIDFSKANKKKNPMKYSNNYLKHSINNKFNNFLHSTSTQEINTSLKKENKTFLNIESNSTKNHHSKSLSYNLDMLNPRPKSSNKRFVNYIKDNKNVKDLKFELNEILQKKSNSKSSRINDLKGGYIYNIQNPIIVSNNMKYTSKIVNDKFSN